MDIPKEFAGRFSIQEELVRRPSAIVYLARDKKLGEREIALKVFLDRPAGNGRWIAEFEDQVQRLRLASHPALVPIIQGGCENEWFYLAMERIEGASLRDVIKDANAPLSTERAFDIARDVGYALHELHSDGLVHSSFDSRAVLFKGEDARVAGFSPPVLAVIQRSVSAERSLLSEPAYISPEQVRGDSIDARADQFSFSVLIFEMLTGKRPYAGANALQIAMARLEGSPPSAKVENPNLSDRIDAAIKRGLSSQPSERFESIPAFLEALGAERSEPMNPLVGMQVPQQIVGSVQTVAVAMTPEMLKSILEGPAAAKTEPVPVKAAPAIESAAAVLATMQGLPSFSDSSQGRDLTSTSQLAVSAGMGASFMILNGDRRGQRFVLSSQDVMIGSDRSCPISISGRNIPPRYAIAVLRNGQWSIAALSPIGITLNGKRVDNASEIPLKRGDVLELGEYQLRFIEAGEVFSLDSASVERSIDKVPNKLPKLFVLGAGLIGVLFVIVFAAYQVTLSGSSGAAERKNLDRLAKKKELIASLRKEGDQFFKEGALTSPPGNNALRRFEQILELDSDDTYAKRRVTEIAERGRELEEQELRKSQIRQQLDKLFTDAERYFVDGRYVAPPGANARESYQAILRLDPQNELAKTKLQELDELLGNLVGKINSLLTQAREFKALGQYVAPAGSNAYDLIRDVLKFDPNNREARDLLYRMAARSVIDGDLAKARADLVGMRKSYLTAQAMGVDPAFIDPRLQGADLIKKSKADVIYFSREAKDGNTSRAKEGSYLDTSELERRIAELKLQEDVAGATEDKKFIDVRQLGKQ